MTLGCQLDKRADLPRTWAIGLLEPRRIRWLIEQPKNSLLYHVPHVLDILDQAGATRFITWLGAFGHPSPKPLECWNTIPELSMYVVRCKRLSDERLASVSKKPRGATLTFESKKSSQASGSDTWRKGTWVTGNKADMRSSQSYPREFAEIIAKAAVRYFKDKTAVKRKRTFANLKGLS